MSDTQTLLPEWTRQEAVILAWPDEQTDWKPWLGRVTQTYLSLINCINDAGAGVILLAREQQVEIIKQHLEPAAQVLMVTADYNDTWVRDYGFLTCQTAQGLQPVEFIFNGWGNKFNAVKDNKVNQQVLSSLCQLPLKSFPAVVEGGALEIDQNGNLLSTKLCLTNPQRNGDMSQEDYKALFAESLGASSTTIFEHGHLEGDDTDGHVDTLVRFTPENALVIQSCFNRVEDSHYKGLQTLVEECQGHFPTYGVYELPLPEIHNEEGGRLPASYANYLICNKHILAPIYQQPEDQLALEVLEKAYPEFKIVPINAQPLIQQFGSVHCISMQVPEGTLKSSVVEKLRSGVSVYD